jgi:hypothetical protein
MAGGNVEFAASFIDSSKADQSLEEMFIVLVFVSDAGLCLSFVTDEIAIVSLSFLFRAMIMSWTWLTPSHG